MAMLFATKILRDTQRRVVVTLSECALGCVSEEVCGASSVRPRVGGAKKLCCANAGRLIDLDRLIVKAKRHGEKVYIQGTSRAFAQHKSLTAGILLPYPALMKECITEETQARPVFVCACKM